MRPRTTSNVTRSFTVLVGLALGLAATGLLLGACQRPPSDPLRSAPASLFSTPTSALLSVPGASRFTADPLQTALPSQSTAPTAAATGTPTAPAGRFDNGLLIADRLNNRLLVVDTAGKILWRFPVAGSLPAGETFSADDAFVSPDGKSIVANEESNQIIVRIDIATQKVIWEYGMYGVHGSGINQLWTPDDAYPLANGDITVADIKNCRVLQIAPDKHIVTQWGTAGVCTQNPPTSFGKPNGDTPLPDGGMLITEIIGAHIVRLSATGDVVFDIVAPVSYPSDAQLLPNGNVLVVDYANPGAVVVIDPATQETVYRYGPTSGDGRLDHPSLVIQLADGTYALNDDHRHRVVVIDPMADSIVWTYGHIDQASSADGYLNFPDGIDVVPAGIFN